MVDLINAKENYKNLPNNVTALRTFGGGNFLSGIEFDDIQVTYPETNIENFAYFKDSELQLTIEVTYADATKKLLTRVRTI